MEIKEVLNIESDNCRRKIVETYTELQDKRENKDFGYTKQLTLMNELYACFVRLDVIYTWKHINPDELLKDLQKADEIDYKTINSHINKVDSFIRCENAMDDLRRSTIVQREVENLKHIIKQATENDWENYNGHYLFDEKR